MRKWTVYREEAAASKNQVDCIGAAGAAAGAAAEVVAEAAAVAAAEWSTSGPRAAPWNSHMHSAQLQSPSGGSTTGGRRQYRWYPLRTEHRVANMNSSHTMCICESFELQLCATAMQSVLHALYVRMYEYV